VPNRLDIGERVDHARRVSHRVERLANRLRVARAERAISQGDLGRLAGVSRQTISSIETAEYTPSALLAFKLAHVLEVPVDELFWLEGVEA
jgi:putative transcriptional regulator